VIGGVAAFCYVCLVFLEQVAPGKFIGLPDLKFLLMMVAIGALWWLPLGVVLGVVLPRIRRAGSAVRTLLLSLFVGAVAGGTGAAALIAWQPSFGPSSRPWLNALQFTAYVIAWSVAYAGITILVSKRRSYGARAQ
jgi:hypothetical protein